MYDQRFMFLSSFSGVEGHTVLLGGPMSTWFGSAMVTGLGLQGLVRCVVYVKSFQYARIKSLHDIALLPDD